MKKVLKFRLFASRLLSEIENEIAKSVFLG